MSTINNNQVVQFHYTLKDDEGNIIDQSPEGQPLAYLHGYQNIIPGLEAQLVGKAVGDKFTASVEPADAYGEFDDAAVQEVPRENFQGVDNIQAGMQFQSQTEDGHVMLVTVKDVQDDMVIVDANHPLAGKKLHFDVEIADIREATPEELQHGHAHGAGGHHH
ncbi:MAG: FKBP-type peptidyl-prolyl cis-trans isomerase [Moraxella sp.]|jgi:FKBP-type peptidyl-prolyl cis-trans isomerase SlyD